MSPQSRPSATLAPAREPAPAMIKVRDDALPHGLQQAVCAFLKGPGWTYGARSEASPDAVRYWYKHFAGYATDGQDLDRDGFEAELSHFPLIDQIWQALKRGPMQGHRLMRCYANCYTYGCEGAVHLDSQIPSHFTAIYYPHMEWRPDYAGETVFFAADGSDIAAAIYPKPNRLIIFPGVIPHVARAITRKCPEPRITLMFKTALDGADSA